MKTISYFLPVFTNMSTLHRVFGDYDKVTATEILHERSIVVGLLERNGVKISARYCTISNKPVTRYECYANGVIVDYSLDRELILKTFRFLLKMQP